MANLNFDATTVAPATGEYEPVPNDTYTMAITASEMKPTANGSGLKLTLAILEGDYKGRQVSEFLNLENTSAQAQEIAQKTLSAICHVTGVLRPKDSAELHNIPFKAKVTVTKPSTGKDGKEYGPGNRVAQYLKVDGNALSVVAGSAPAAAPKKASVPAWAAKAS